MYVGDLAPSSGKDVCCLTKCLQCEVKKTRENEGLPTLGGKHSYCGCHDNNVYFNLSIYIM